MTSQLNHTPSSSDKNVRWGIIGLGQIAVDWIAPAILDCPNSELVACCGRRPDASRAFAERFGVASVHHSFESLAADPLVDAIYIATPNDLHHAPVLAAARHRKHVLCEKPFALSIDHALEMASACDAAGVILRIAHQIRLEPALQRVLEVVRSGVLGDLRCVTFERTAPTNQPGAWRRQAHQGGTLFDVAVHQLDLVTWTTGLSMTEVIAFTHPDRRAGLPDETVSITGRLGERCVANIRASRELPYGKNDLIIEGTRGMLSTSALRWVDEFSVQVKDASGVSEMRFKPVTTYRREVEVFADEVRGRRSFLPDGSEGVAMVRLVAAILESIQTGQIVRVAG